MDMRVTLPRRGLRPIDGAEPGRTSIVGDQAVTMGLRASVSVPLIAGSGEPVAVLNLYGHDAAAMAPLTEAVWRVYKPDPVAAGGAVGDLEPGAAELMAGLAEAFAVRATIQQAVGVIMARHGVGAFDAYLSLHAPAAETGSSLTTTAAAVIQQLSDHGDRPDT